MTTLVTEAGFVIVFADDSEGVLDVSLWCSVQGITEIVPLPFVTLETDVVVCVMTIVPL